MEGRILRRLRVMASTAAFLLGGLFATFLTASVAIRVLQSIYETKKKRPSFDKKQQTNGGFQSKKPLVPAEHAAESVAEKKTWIFRRNSTIPILATILSQRKLAPQMTAPEDSIELDEENDTVDTFVQVSKGMAEAESKIANLKSFVSSISAPENPLLTSVNCMGCSSSISTPVASKKACDASYISEKESRNKFPVAIESGDHSLSAVMPSMPTTSQDNLATQCDQKVAPPFIFGSRAIDAPVPSIVSRESADEKAAVESRPELICPDRKIQLDGSNVSRSVRSHADGLYKSPVIFGLYSPSIPRTSDAAVFGSLISSPRISGSIPSSSMSSLVSASTWFFSNSTSTTSSSLSAPPPFSSTTTVNFGAGASIAAPVSIPHRKINLIYWIQKEKLLATHHLEHQVPLLVVHWQFQAWEAVVLL